ncbi:MAG: hypothetical protein WBN89_16725 [Prochlorococcaceae cyanobacterium]
MTSQRLARLGRYSIKALRIGASTAVVVEALRQHWIQAACFAAAWLLAIEAQRLAPEDPDPADSP